MTKFLYNIYQIIFGIPIVVIVLIVCTIFIVIGTRFGNANYWAYHPGRIWSKVTIRSLFLPVKVEGRENINENDSYVFVSNHQGAFDIFLIYGYLNKNFKWLMKYQLFKIPFLGTSCRACKHIPVDKRSPRKIKETYDTAREFLKHGMSVVLFSEGARTFTGHMGSFKRGGFLLADELQLPVVPLTINGSFNVKPRTNDMGFVNRHQLTLTIHKPIYPTGKGPENVKMLMEKSYEEIQKALVPEYQGYVENPDQ